MRLLRAAAGRDESSMSAPRSTRIAAPRATPRRPAVDVGMWTSGLDALPGAAALPGACTVAAAGSRPGTERLRWIGVPLGTRLWYVKVNVPPISAEMRPYAAIRAVRLVACRNS